MSGTLDVRVGPERDFTYVRLAGFFDDALLTRFLAEREGEHWVLTGESAGAA